MRRGGGHRDRRLRGRGCTCARAGGPRRHRLPALHEPRHVRLDHQQPELRRRAKRGSPENGTSRHTDHSGVSTGRRAITRPARTTPPVPGKFEPFEPPVEKKPDDTFDLKPVTGTHQPITPPPIDLTRPVTVKLPGPAETVTVGGNGRYIVFHIPSTQQLAVFDASKGATRRDGESAGTGRLFLAGGQNRVVTCDQDSRILRSYTLPELEEGVRLHLPAVPPPGRDRHGLGREQPAPDHRPLRLRCARST